MSGRSAVFAGLAVMFLLFSLVGHAASDDEEIPVVVLEPSDALEFDLAPDAVREVRLIAEQPFQIAWLSTSSEDPGSWGRIIGALYPKGEFEATSAACGPPPTEWSRIWTTTGSNVPPDTPEHPAGEYTLLLGAEIPSTVRLYFDDPAPALLGYWLGHTARSVDAATSQKTARFVHADVAQFEPAPVRATFDETVTLERDALGMGLFSAVPAFGTGTSSIQTRFGDAETACAQTSVDGAFLSLGVAAVSFYAEFALLAGPGTYEWSGDYNGDFGTWSLGVENRAVAAAGFIQLP